MGSAVDAKILFSASGDLKYTSVESGSANNWKTGKFELGQTVAGHCICILNFTIGRQKSFKLTNNIRGISKCSNNPGRFTLALKSGANISLCKGNIHDVQKLNSQLEQIKNAKLGKKSHHGTQSFDLPTPTKSATTPGSHGHPNTPLRASQNNGARMTPSNSLTENNSNTISGRTSGLGNSLNGSRLSQAQHVATRRSTAGFDLEDDDDVISGINASFSSEEEAASLPSLFVDERDDQLDKENRSSASEPRGVLRQRKQEGGSMFMMSYQEKAQRREEKDRQTPVVAISNKSFYGASRGKDMLFASKLGGGAAVSSINRSSSKAVKRPGLLQTTSSVVKKLRNLDVYDGWRNKTNLFKPTNISLRGFSNLGNTCYMNAILQSLFGLNSFTEDLLKLDVTHAVEKVSLYWAVTSLLQAKQQRWSADQIGSKLRLVKTAISSTATRFSGYMQHDAHEFLCQCLDQLKEDIDNANKKVANINDASSTPPHLPCPITQNFEFKVLHTIRCKECGEEVTKTEEFYDLSLDLPRINARSGLTANIQTALDQFFRVEEIEYACSQCDCKLASVYHKFTKLPRIMIVHLKRYTFDVEASVNAKLRQPISIPKYLTLAWHCAQDTLPPLTWTRTTNGYASTTPSNSKFPLNDSSHQRVSDSNHGNIRKKLNYQFSPKAEAKSPFSFKRKRRRTDSDSDLEKDPFSNLEDEETHQALAESKAEEKKRRHEEDELKQVLEDSKQEVDVAKEITSMTEEEQIEYAMALSRGECIDHASDSNGNHKLNGTTQNGDHSWSNSVFENGYGHVNGLSETDSNGFEPTHEPAEYAQLGKELEQRLPECSRTGEASPTDKHNGVLRYPHDPANRTAQMGVGQWGSRPTSPNGGVTSGHGQINGDSGFASPDFNGQLDDTELPIERSKKDLDDETSYKQTSNDSAIDLDVNKENQAPPTIPQKKSKVDYSNIIDLCGEEKDHSGGGGDGAGDGVNYAELKAKEDEEMKRAMELSLQDCKHLDETEEEQLRRAQEMSLEEFNKSIGESMEWDRSLPAELQDDTPMYTEEQLEEINANIENGSIPHSYRLVSVVNHIGASSSAGHYVSDVYDSKKDAWFSYDDSDVQKIDESTVREQRRRSGYIFFYAVNYH